MSSFYCLIVTTCLFLTIDVIYALENFRLGQNFVPPPRPTLTPGRFFLKIESLHPWVIGKAPTKYEVDWLSTFCAIEIDISGRLELVNSIFNFQETGTGIGIEISGRLELANYIFNSKFIPPITRIMFCYIIQISKIECPPLFSNTVGLSKSNFSVHK